MSLVDTIVQSKISDVYWAQLGQDADLYNAILEIARRQNITTGVVLNVVGGLKRARLSAPPVRSGVESQPGIIELDGTMECSGFGIIGVNRDTFDAESTSGIINRAGEPYLHVHLTVSHGHQAIMGHLIEGCLVRSLHAKSHFTIVVARTEGVLLEFCVDKQGTAHYPKGLPWHHLRSA